MTSGIGAWAEITVAAIISWGMPLAPPLMFPIDHCLQNQDPLAPFAGIDRLSLRVAAALAYLKTTNRHHVVDAART